MAIKTSDVPSNTPSELRDSNSVRFRMSHDVNKESGSGRLSNGDNFNSIRRRSAPAIDIGNLEGSDASDESRPPVSSDKNECHICGSQLRMRRFKHNCRNCGESVCSNHSRNFIPLPKYGIMKEVRVCDICIRHVVQRRTGYRNSDASNESIGRMDHANDKGLSIGGVIMRCQVEVQDSTMDDILYLGTLRMGSRSLASRNLHANMAIWKERTLLLTHAELMCVKCSEESEMGEVRTSVHMTDILHVEVHDQQKRVLTIVRSDGRLFRLRAQSPEECMEISQAMQLARQKFQHAMHALQRGPRDEDNQVSIVTIKDAQAFEETVIQIAPTSDKYFEVDMYESSTLQIYVHGPVSSGVVVVPFSLVQERAGNGEFCVKTSLLPGSIHENPLSVYIRIGLQEPSYISVDYITNTMMLLLGVASYFLTTNLKVLGIILWTISTAVLTIRWWPNFRLILESGSAWRSYRLLVCITKIMVSICEDLQEEEELADEDIDIRYIEGCRGDMVDARRRYKRTLKWRKEKNIDRLLLTKQPHFDTMKEVYKQYTHKRDKFGHLITIEATGNLKKAMQEFMGRGVSQEEAIMHQVFVTEYTWKILDPRKYPDGMQLKIVDISGISITDINGEVLNFMRQCGQTIGDNNPERLWKVFILNPPPLFGVLWKLVSPLINPKTRDKTHVIRGQKEIAKVLLEYIDPENLPVEYGGQCACLGGCSHNSPEEIDLREYVHKLNNTEDMEPILAKKIAKADDYFQGSDITT